MGVAFLALIIGLLPVAFTGNHHRNNNNTIQTSINKSITSPTQTSINSFLNSTQTWLNAACEEALGEDGPHPCQLLHRDAVIWVQSAGTEGNDLVLRGCNIVNAQGMKNHACKLLTHYFTSWTIELSNATSVCQTSGQSSFVFSLLGEDKNGEAFSSRGIALVDCSLEDMDPQPKIISADIFFDWSGAKTILDDAKERAEEGGFLYMIFLSIYHAVCLALWIIFQLLVSIAGGASFIAAGYFIAMLRVRSLSGQADALGMNEEENNEVLKRTDKIFRAFRRIAGRSSNHIIFINTSNQRRAGTDGEVALKFFHENEEVTEVSLSSSQSNNVKFKRGQMDQFVCNFPDLHLKKVIVHLKKSSKKGPSRLRWVLQTIAVVSQSNEHNYVVFDCNDAVFDSTTPRRVFYPSRQHHPSLSHVHSKPKHGFVPIE
eukprot:m.342846 g.342846  ORF g.342846 m.342846 type:complete len:430 (-) comp21912_c0_seq1:542-1831(-)